MPADDWRTIGDREFVAGQVRGNPLLAGLAETYGCQAVYDAALKGLNIPPALISTANEACEIAQLLSQPSPKT